MSSAHRAYIPTNAHSNQYILAEIKTNDEFYQAFASVEDCYARLSQRFFRAAEDASLHNVHFIANDKLPVVRYHTEFLAFQTERQILFFYNPLYHEAQNQFIKPDHKARKIRLLFLATGTDLRANSAEFHKKVQRVLKTFKSDLPDVAVDFKVRDHQHLSFDLFAADKDHRETYAYKLRSLPARYEKRQCALPEQSGGLTYVTTSIPLSRRIKFHLKLTDHNYSALYSRIEQAFATVCSEQGLDHVAFVANGRSPLVRSRKVDISESNDELQKISFDTSTPSKPVVFWEEDKLVESLNFIFVASDDDNTQWGYGRFVNHVQTALTRLAKEIGVQPECDDVTVRFYQHISYYL